MNRITQSAAIALIGMTSLVAASAYGGMIENPVLSGGSATKYIVDPSDNTKLIVDNAANLSDVLMGDSTDPLGNVELGKLGSSPPTVLSGEFGGDQIRLSGLVESDWTDNGNALATAYITDAAASASISLTPVQISAIVTAFIADDKWERPSDPNIGYVNRDGGVVKIGLEGLFDATDFLQGLLPAGSPALPPGLQVSEVVKVTYKGQMSYLYGFYATETGRTSSDGESYSGNYEVTVPETGTLALLSLGFGLVGLARRRASR